MRVERYQLNTDPTQKPGPTSRYCQNYLVPVQDFGNIYVANFQLHYSEKPCPVKQETDRSLKSGIQWILKKFHLRLRSKNRNSRSSGIRPAVGGPKSGAAAQRGPEPSKITTFDGSGVQEHSILTGTNGRSSSAASGSLLQTMPTKNQSLASREVSKSGKVTSVDDIVAQKKEEAKERLVAEILDWIDRRLYLMAQIYGHTANACGNDSGPPPDSNLGSGSDRHQKPSRGQKRSRQGDNPDDWSAGGDGHGHDRGGNKKSKTTSSKKRRLACPFYKHNPTKDGHRRACLGPGYTDFHRLKEHITRVHVSDKHRCMRCQEKFANAKALEVHLRAKIACELNESVPVDELSQVQAEFLKKKSTGNVSDEERWKELYCHIFPHADRSSIPSPYYDHNERSKCRAGAAAMEEYTQHLRTTLPHLLTVEVEKTFEGYSDQVKEILPTLLRNCLTAASASFKHKQQPPRRSFEKDDDEAFSDEQEVPASNQSRPEVSILPDEDMASLLFMPEGTSLDDAFLDFEGLTYDFDAGSDSGFSNGSNNVPEEFYPSTTA